MHAWHPAAAANQLRLLLVSTCSGPCAFGCSAWHTVLCLQPLLCCGFPLLRSGFGGPECSACKPGTFSTGGSTAPCQLCDPGLTSPPGSAGPAFCSCPAGQGASLVVPPTNGSSACSVCPPGSYSSGPAAAAVRDQRGRNTTAQPIRLAARSQLAQPCTLCPEGMTSPAGATDVGQCGECGIMLNGTSSCVWESVSCNQCRNTLKRPPSQGIEAVITCRHVEATRHLVSDDAC